MKKILITIIAEDDKFDTSTFMNEFISFRLSKSAKEYHIKDLYYEERFFGLTEDERVILRNMQHVDTIKRIDGHIYVDNSIETENYYREEFSRYMVEFDHLFQFIKERRRILYWRTIERSLEMKYEKERKFVKEVNEALKEEVIVSRIEILQVNLKEDRSIYEVIYKDRFGNKYMVDNLKGYRKMKMKE